MLIFEKDKKYIVVLMLVFLLLPLTTNGSTINKLSRTFNNTGLVGYWTFDGGDTSWGTSITQDRSGQGNNGIMSNMSTTSSPLLGKIGQALNFTTAEWVYVGNPSVFSNLNNLSISVWIKPRSFSGGADKIVSKTGGVNPGWVLSIEDQSNIEFQVNYNTTDLFVIFNSSNAFSNTKWTNVILTWDGTSQASGAKLYADGVEITNRLANQNGSASRSDDANTPIVIGARSDTGGPRFSGQIDDVRIYNRVLSATEAGQITNAGKAKVNKSSTNFLTSGLVGYWTFDGGDINWSTGTIRDKSQFATVGYLVNMSTTTSPSMGKVGQSLRFVGGSNFTYVDTQDFGVPDMTGPYTISAWIYPNGWGGSNQGWIFRSNNYTLGLSAASAGIRLDNGDNATFAATSNSTITLNKWQHIAAVYDGSGAVNLYVDGVDRTSDSTITESNSGGFVYISDNGGGNSFDGMIDDVRTYSRALSASEIKQLYNSGQSRLNSSSASKNLIPSGLVGYWTFDGPDINWGTGIVTDRSGQGNNGSINNMSTTTSPKIGKLGQGLSFDGVDDRVTFSALNIGTVYTTSFWIQYNDSGDAVVIGNLDVIDGTTGYTPYIDGTTIYARTSTLADGFVSASHGGFTPGVWYYIAIVRNGTRIDFYKNGVSLGGGNLSGNNSTSIRSIGSYGDGSFPLLGYLDDVRVYNRALSTTEIMLIYNSGK